MVGRLWGRITSPSTSWRLSSVVAVAIRRRFQGSHERCDELGRGDVVADELEDEAPRDLAAVVLAAPDFKGVPLAKRPAETLAPERDPELDRRGRVHGRCDMVGERARSVPSVQPSPFNDSGSRPGASLDPEQINRCSSSE